MRWYAPVLVLASVGSLAQSETIAILPFANVSGSAIPNAAGMDWIGASIAETVREALTGHAVDAFSREEVAESYALLRLRPLAEITQASILKLGEALKADRLLHGTFAYRPPPPGAPAGARGVLTIRSRILHLASYEQTAVLEETGNLEDLPGLEAHLSWRVVALMDPAGAPPESEYISLRTPVRLDAEENYIRGLLAPTPEQQEKYYLQALRLDPRYGRPALELGKILMARKTYREAATLLEQLQPADTGYLEATFLLGVSKFHSGDIQASQECFERLAQSVPASGVFNNLGAAQSRNGLAEAAVQFRKALEGDPNNPDYHFNLAYILLKTEDFDAAADGFRGVLDRDPNDAIATLLLGRSLTRQAPRKDATADARLMALERIEESFPDLRHR